VGVRAGLEAVTEEIPSSEHNMPLPGIESRPSRLGLVAYQAAANCVRQMISIKFVVLVYNIQEYYNTIRVIKLKAGETGG
jgi:hypothetical protein